jgi:hypothetical protein
MKRFTILAVALGFVLVSLTVVRPALSSPQDEIRPPELPTVEQLQKEIEGSQDEKKSSEPPTLEQLQKERIAALELVVEKTRRMYETSPGQVSLLELFESQRDLVEAKLDATDSVDERIALLKQQVQVAQGIFDYLSKMHAVGFRTTDREFYQAKAHLLKIKIILAKEQKKAKNAG